MLTDHRTDDELPSLVPLALGVNDNSADPLPVPTAPLDSTVSPLTSFAGLKKTYHSNKSVGLPSVLNLLQQILAGAGPNDKVAAAHLRNTFYPPSLRRDWQLAKWLIDSSLTCSEIDTFLKLDRVCIIFHHIHKTLTGANRSNSILRASVLRTSCLNGWRIFPISLLGSLKS